MEVNLITLLATIFVFGLLVFVHELGHFLDPSDRWATPQQTREINADQLAVKLGLGKSLQTALGKLIDDNPDNQELVKGMIKRISLLVR